MENKPFNYNDYSHIHCWDQKQPPACGISLAKHTQCCLCEKKVPENKLEQCCVECYHIEMASVVTCADDNCKCHPKPQKKEYYCNCQFSDEPTNKPHQKECPCYIIPPQGIEEVLKEIKDKAIARYEDYADIGTEKNFTALMRALQVYEDSFARLEKEWKNKETIWTLENAYNMGKLEEHKRILEQAEKIGEMAGHKHPYSEYCLTEVIKIIKGE